MGACLVTAGKFVHKSKLVQRRVQMAPQDVGFKKRRSVFRLKQKPGLAISHERVEQVSYPRVQVYLAIRRICLDALFDLALSRLLPDADGPEIR